MVKNLYGKYSKQALNRLDRIRLNEDDHRMVRKIILDAFGDMQREAATQNSEEFSISESKECTCDSKIN